MSLPPRPVAPVEVAGRLRTVIGQLGRHLRLLHADTGLSPSQHEVLGTVVRRGPIRLSEVAELEGLNPTMLSRIATKLETAGLVTRSQDAQDGRVAHLAATGAGRALHDEIRAARTDALLLVLEQLSEREKRALASALPVLETLVEALKQRAR